MTKKSEKTKPVKKKTPKRVSQRDRLEKELKGLLKKVDEQGLLFLLKQAQVIIHNLQVDKINKEIVVYESKKKTIAKGKSNKVRKEKTTGVCIEEINQGKSFFITLKNARKIFDLAEMRSLVKICHGAGDSVQAGIRLYRWFARNRKDVLSDCAIAGNADPYIILLYNTIIKTYEVKKR